MDRIIKLRQLLDENPSDNFLEHALALEYIKEGNDKSAQQVFETLLFRDPSYIGSYYHLGKLLERNGNVENALACYEKGMEQAKLVNDSHAFGELRAAFEELSF